ADRRRRDKQHAEDWRRAGLPPLDRYTDYDGHDSAGPLPEKLEKPEKNEATNAGEISGDAIAVRPPTAAGPRKRLERRANHGRNGAAQRHGGNGIDKTTARGRGPLPRPDGWGPASGS
ncbi:MAG: hypothetical protein V3S64_10120, partial [bacterium]